MRHCRMIPLLIAAAAWPALLAAAEPLFTQLDLFRAGEDGYHSYRIPSIVATRKGTLLAFCEGRRNSRSNQGDIDLLVRRSFDNGKTWTHFQVVADHGSDTIGNPTPVVDQRTGRIWVLLTGNPGHVTQEQILDAAPGATRTVWITSSTDDGATWSPPVDITVSVKRPEWTWYATGPGNGIQLRSGRLVVPCDHYLKGSERYSHVIYSDDRGESWKIGGVVGPKTNECQVVELADRSLLINMRSYHDQNRRAIARSRDGGLSWFDLRLDPALIEPTCQASFLRFTARPRFSRNRVLFSNPADTRRVKMTVRLSYDEGETWPVARLLEEGPSAYSSLVVLPDFMIGCLYERGEKSAYEKITFARMNLEWLTGGSDRLQ